jgi:cytoskeleton protein RodZ
MVMMDGSGSTETNRAAGGGLAEIGAMLRKRREEVGQDLAAISAVTHIKPMFLRAIEEGRRKDLPGTAYMIGYIRTYADYLGFDGNRLITDYHADLAGPRKWVDKRADPVEEPAVPLSQIQANPVVVLGGLVILALAAYGVWSIFFGGRGESETAVPETPTEAAAPAAPAPSEEPADTAAKPEAQSPTNAEASTGTEPAATAEEVPPADAAPAEAPAAAEDQVPPEADVASTGEDVAEESPPQQEAATEGKAGKIVVRARLESWIQVTNEKKDVLFSRVLRAGETYTVPEEKGLLLTTGNAGGIEISVNGRKLKSLGTVGLVKRDIPLDPKKLQDGSAFRTSKSAPVTN